MKIGDLPMYAFLFGVSLINSATAEAQRYYRDDHRDYHRGYDYHRHSYPVRVQRTVYNYHPRYVTPYRSYPYYYNDNYFYRPYRSSVQVVAPRIGIRVTVLPRDYRPVYMGSQVYFYSNGIFYRRAERDYEVVRAPLGAELPEIPDNARVIVIDDQKYYEYEGTYFKERIKRDGEIWYEVVGKDGRLQTDAATRDVRPGDVRPGSLLNSLPPDSKIVIINNQKYYVSPDHVYYEEVIENNRLYYRATETPY
jgi:hypothetical protein